MLKHRKIWYIMPDEDTQPESGRPRNDNNNVFGRGLGVNLYVYWSALWRTRPLVWENYYTANS